jgi:hypothetical protein
MKKQLSALQRHWIMTLYQEERWHCSDSKELWVENQFFAHYSGLRKLQQTQRDQVMELVSEGWLEIVPETAKRKSVSFRLTVWGRDELEKICHPWKVLWKSVPKSIEKMGIQPKLFSQSGEQLSNLSVSGEPAELTKEEIDHAFFAETL